MFATACDSSFPKASRCPIRRQRRVAGRRRRSSLSLESVVGEINTNGPAPERASSRAAPKEPHVQTSFIVRANTAATADCPPIAAFKACCHSLPARRFLKASSPISKSSASCSSKSSASRAAGSGLEITLPACKSANSRSIAAQRSLISRKRFGFIARPSDEPRPQIASTPLSAIGLRLRSTAQRAAPRRPTSDRWDN